MTISAESDDTMILPSVINENIKVSASFVCLLKNVSWFFGKPINEPLCDKSKYILSNLNYSNSGFYFCYGKSVSSDKFILAKAVLKVYGE